MKKTTQPTRQQIMLAITGQITIDLPKGELDGIISECEDLCNTSYKAGHDEGMVDGALEYENDNPPVNQEKLCTEYVVEKFGEVKSFEEFTEIYNELRNISYTYMK